MKLAAIDIGSNSIHMIVARIDGDGSIETIDRMKEMARLGEETLSTGYLSESAQERGIDAIRKLKALADSYHVDAIIAVATSATREARNGADFIRRVSDECGVSAKIITGIEEGRLIYLGTREVFPYGSQKALIIDIGGGSVELILADQRREYLVKSLKLGVRRLKDRFLPSIPPSTEEIDELTTHIRLRAESIVRSVRRRGFDTILGTSGTAAALARIAHMSEEPATDSSRVARDLLARTVDRLTTLSDADLPSVPGLDDRRRDVIVHGAVLMRTLVEAFGGDGFSYCDAALREGMIVDYLERNRPGLRYEDQIPDPRRRSVVMLAARFYNSIAHPTNVSRLAVRVFDDTREMHGLGRQEREILEYASLLHNVGNAINRSSHHKHSLYIIKHGDLSGFSDRERMIMANLARYHRRSAPKSRHPEYMALTPRDREIVKKLAVILRLANAMDRGHRGNVHSLGCKVDGPRLELRFCAHDDPTIELAASLEQADFVRTVFGKQLDVAVADFIPKQL